MTPRRLAWILALALCTEAGCATVERDRALSREQMLAQAGFEKKLAESPAQQSELQRLPSRMLVRVPRGGDTAYVYADVEYCRCLYAGNEQAYSDFLAAVTREFIYNDTLGNPNPIPTPSPEATARYENLARDSILDPTTEASVDWRIWD
jgi:hypothetical protein